MKKIKQFLFKNTSTKQTVVKNTFWLFTGEIGVRILKLLLFIYAARKLGTSEWGVFSYSLALMSTFSIISDIGVNSILTREVSRKTEQLKEYISTSLVLKLGLSVISSIGLLLIVIFINEDNPVKVLIPITAIILFFDSIREFGFSLNRAFEKMEVEAFIKLLTNLILILFGIFFISISPKAISLSYSYVISGIIGVFIIYINLKDHFKNILANFSKKILPLIFKEAIPIAIIGIIGTIMTNLDMIILGWFSTSSEIGIYSAAQKPIQIIYLVPALLTTAIFPVFSRLAITDKEKMKGVIKKSVKISLLMAIIINIGIFLIGGPIFKIMFGPQYLNSIPLLKIMGLAIISGAPGIIISNAIFAIGEQKELLKFVLISLILNIIMCLILIPKFGITGAAISVTMAQTIGNTILIIRSKKILC